MEINFNRNNASLEVSRFSGAEPQSTSDAQPSNLKSQLTITQSAASPEEISAAAIPDEALLRDDDLGKAINAAFNLPPPPMPYMV
jgi:hypothetical protein